MPVEFKKENHVAYVTLNRPEAMNSLDPESLAQIKQILTDIKADHDVRVTVLTGAGEKAFSTGTDMKKTKPPTECMAAVFLKDEPMTPLPYFNMWKPLICAVNGFAVGGGMEMALACDIRIASTNAKFGLTEVKVASLAGINGTQAIGRVIPHAVAMKMLLTGEMIDAQEAYRVGLISDLVEPAELMPTAKKMAERIAQNAPLSVKAAKMAAVLGKDMPYEHSLMYSQLLWGVLRDTEDRKEGFTAFAEKRAPVWSGK
ncbi:MAG: enoyl-CoA hydratase-related protein [Desulfobacterales bacterium]|jgi:E-phenylitaconyl-CoA hydratase/naphthyl-2-hydroxymethylsuccinyl-CoA hydratase|nr:enoyl-CoA hydratase-related protein [Desulfobacterales bacterium]